MRIIYTIFLIICSLTFLWLDYYEIGLLCSISSYLFYLNVIRIDNNLNSVYFFFMIFFGLYGYSIPISVYFGLDIGWRKVEKLPIWDQVDDTLISFLISNQFALLGLVLAYVILTPFNFKNQTIFHKKSTQNNLTRFSFLIAALTSLSEFINFIRAGGFSSLSKGKAYYQSMVSELPLNIPSDVFFFISIAIFSVALLNHTNTRNRIKSIFIFTLLLSIYLFINAFIGERGAILVGFIIFLLGYSYYKEIKTIKFYYILAGIVLFFAFNVMTVLREPYASFNGLSFFKDYKRQLTYLSNPANTEFSSSSYNYRIYLYNKKKEDAQLRYGSTYLDIAIGIVPSYIIKDKPKAIAYEYRDEFHSERKKQGSVAGTGFSALLEAYINFSYLGPIMIYFILGLSLGFLEKIKYYPSKIALILYLASFNIFMIFSRSGSKSIFLSAIYFAFAVILVSLLYKIFFSKRKISISDKCDE